MNSVKQCSVNGFGSVSKGVRKKLGVIAVATGLAVAAFAPVSAQAETITQLECLQWLAQVTGESGQADYVQWAKGKGINPAGGIQANAVLTREALAQIVGQLLGLNGSKRGASDWAQRLQREGIELPSELDRASIVSMIGSMNDRLGTIAATDPSPRRKGNAGRGNGEDPPPPGWNKNPRNPHFGVPEEPGR